MLWSIRQRTVYKRQGFALSSKMTAEEGQNTETSIQRRTQDLLHRKTVNDDIIHLMLPYRNAYTLLHCTNCFFTTNILTYKSRDCLQYTVLILSTKLPLYLTGTSSELVAETVSRNKTVY